MELGHAVANASCAHEEGKEENETRRTEKAEYKQFPARLASAAYLFQGGCGPLV